MTFSVKKHLTMLYMANVLGGLSTCEKHKVGCILTDTKYKILGSGYNGTEPGADNTCEENGKTLPSVIHAEINALQMYKQCKPTDELYAFVTHAPCSNCMEQLIKHGVTRVYYMHITSSGKQSVKVNAGRLTIYKVPKYLVNLLGGRNVAI